MGGTRLQNKSKHEWHHYGYEQSIMVVDYLWTHCILRMFSNLMYFVPGMKSDHISAKLLSTFSFSFPLPLHPPPPPSLCMYVCVFMPAFWLRGNHHSQDSCLSFKEKLLSWHLKLICKLGLDQLGAIRAHSGAGSPIMLSCWLHSSSIRHWPNTLSAQQSIFHHATVHRTVGPSSYIFTWRTYNTNQW